jgi:hypothetical protein
MHAGIPAKSVQNRRKIVWAVRKARDNLLTDAQWMHHEHRNGQQKGMLMTMHYQQIALTDVKPGMILSDDLLDHHGQVLLAQGSVLTDAMIEALHRHQVAFVPVASGEASVVEALVEETHFGERIDTLFRKLPQDDRSINSVLRDYVRDFRFGVTV